MATTQVLRGSGELIRQPFFVDGAYTDPDDSVITLTLTRDDGTAIVTDTAATRLSAGIYGYQLAAQADLDHLTATWTGLFSGQITTAVSRVDVVGGYYVGLNELRAIPDLSNTTTYPTAKLIDARQWFETTFERYTGRAFVPRYKRITVWGNGTDTIQLPDEYLRPPLRAVTFGTVDLSDAALANTVVEGSGRIQRYWPSSINGPDDTWGTYGSSFPVGTRITIAYEYGLDSPDSDIHEAAVTAITDRLLDNNTGRREYAAVTDLGIIRYSKPGDGRPFGIESVDRVANDRRRKGWKADALTAGSVGIG